MKNAARQTRYLHYVFICALRAENEWKRIFDALLLFSGRAMRAEALQEHQ